MIIAISLSASCSRARVFLCFRDVAIANRVFNASGQMACNCSFFQACYHVDVYTHGPARSCAWVCARAYHAFVFPLCKSVFLCMRAEHTFVWTSGVDEFALLWILIRTSYLSILFYLSHCWTCARMFVLMSVCIRLFFQSHRHGHCYLVVVSIVCSCVSMRASQPYFGSSLGRCAALFLLFSRALIDRRCYVASCPLGLLAYPAMRAWPKPPVVPRRAMSVRPLAWRASCSYRDLRSL